MGRARTGSVVRIGDHFVARIALGGGKKSSPIHLPASFTEAQARAVAADLSAKSKAGLLVQMAQASATETVDRYFDRWFNDREARGYADVGRERGRFRKWVAPAIGHLLMGSVTARDLESLVERLDRAARIYADHEARNEVPPQASSLSWKSARNVWGLVTSAFSDAARSKTLALRVLDKNPALEVRAPDKGTSKARSFLSPPRFLRFVGREDVPLHWRRIVTVAVYTGLRASELRGVLGRDVKIEDGYMLVHRTISAEQKRGSTKTDKPRRVRIEPELVPLLVAMRGEPDKEAFELPDDRHMARGLRRWLSRADLDDGDLVRTATSAALTWHDLRATTLTWRAIRGDAHAKIQRGAGHSNPGTTERYIRTAEALDGWAIDVFPPLPTCLIRPEIWTASAAESTEAKSQQHVARSGRWDLNPPHGHEKAGISRVRGDLAAGDAQQKPQEQGAPVQILSESESDLPGLAKAVRSLSDSWDLLELAAGGEG